MIPIGVVTGLTEIEMTVGCVCCAPLPAGCAVTLPEMTRWPTHHFEVVLLLK